MDMTLEKEYSKPAKIAGGLIGITRKKEGVAIWNFTKYEKDRQVAILTNCCDITEESDSELDFHHEFNPSSARISSQRVADLLQYMESVSNIICNSVHRLQHLCSPENFPEIVVEGISSFLTVGEEGYQKFRSDVLQSKLLGYMIPFLATRILSNLSRLKIPNRKM